MLKDFLSLLENFIQCLEFSSDCWKVFLFEWFFSATRKCYLMLLNFSMSLLNEKFHTQSWPFYACNSRYCISIEILHPYFNLKHWMFLNIVLKVFMDQMFNFNLMHFDAGILWITITRNILFYDNLMFYITLRKHFYFTVFYSFSCSILSEDSIFFENLLFLQCTLNNIYLQRCYEKLERVIYLFLGLYHRFET